VTITLTAQNWQTTVGGLLAGIPSIIIASGLMLTMKETQILAIISGVGTLLIGLAAKDSGTHSTIAQVQQATIKANEAAPPAPPKV
jgi:hypothetical protein